MEKAPWKLTAEMVDVSGRTAMVGVFHTVSQCITFIDLFYDGWEFIISLLVSKFYKLENFIMRISYLSFY